MYVYICITITQVKIQTVFITPEGYLISFAVDPQSPVSPRKPPAHFCHYRLLLLFLGVHRMDLKDCSVCALQHLPSFAQHNDLRSSPIVACINSSFQFIDKSIPYSDLPSLCIRLGFPDSSVGKLQCRRPWFDSWLGKIPWRRDRLLTPVCCLGESHGLYST